MTFAGCRRCKRLLLHASAFNLGLLMRTRFGYGPPRALQGLTVAQAALVERVAKAAYRYVIRLANGILRAVGLRMGRSWLRSRDRHADAPLQIDACCPPRIRSEPGFAAVARSCRREGDMVCANGRSADTSGLHGRGAGEFLPRVRAGPDGSAGWD